MDVQLVVVGEDDHTRDLFDWLLADNDLRGRVEREQASPRAGEMGAVSDVLTVALGSGGVATALVTSLRVWLTQRHSDVKVEIRSADGRSIVVDASRVNEVDAILREALDGIEGD